jgi:hypothetical protein
MGRYAVNVQVEDRRGGFYVEAILVSLALWWGLFRTASRLVHRH